MDSELLSRLCTTTSEEQAILDGRTSIDRDIYMQGVENTVNSRKLLSSGKLITLRPHTRFIDFPPHRHDYVEMIYMCAGRTTHLVNGKEILLRQGELLLLSQSAVHAVRRAEQGDVAVNFIVLPDFFTATLSAIGEEETPLRRFLVDCLCGQNSGHGYLHFQVSGVKPLQNLVENLIWALLYETPNRRKVSQMTMATLFLQLMGNMESLMTDDGEEAAVLKALRYVERDYTGGSLSELAQSLHYDVCWLSREIKRKTGKTYTQIVQDKRLAQAAFLLKNTDRNVSDISQAVGYENVSYFHRIFFEAYGKSPPAVQSAREDTFLDKSGSSHCLHCVLNYIYHGIGGLIYDLLSRNRYRCLLWPPHCWLAGERRNSDQRGLPLPQRRGDPKRTSCLEYGSAS